MKLNNAVLFQSLPGYALPQYDRQAMARRSRQQPTWLHFGAGNLFRAFPAVLAQRLLNAGETDTGVLCCEAYDTDAVTQFLRPYDDLTLSVSLLADGSMEKEVVGSIAQSLTLPQDRCRVEEIFRAPSLQMVSFTITEKGYAVNAAVKEDMGRAPGEAQTLLGVTGSGKTFTMANIIARCNRPRRCWAPWQPAAWPGLKPAAPPWPWCPWTTAPRTGRSCGRAFSRCWTPGKPPATCPPKPTPGPRRSFLSPGA